MGLDQLQLLRSQHKMARLLLVAALCLASGQAAVIPVEEIVDNLQSFLTAPEESGLRLKRSTGEWDKEFDLSSMGILFQLKYNNPANPFEGGRAHVKVPGARLIRNAPFDDMDLDIEFNGGSAIDGLFDMKVDYKFIQKFMFLADRPQEGSFVLYRKMEGGMWKTKVTVDNNNMMPKPFLDISVESDGKTKLHVLFNFQEDNKWELKVDRVPGQKMTIEATVNGQKWTGVGNLNQGEMKLNLKMDSEMTGKHFNVDFDLNPSGMWGLHVTGDVDGPVDIKWTMQKDFTMGEISMKYKNQNYAFMQLKGNAEMRGMIPVMFDYVVKYNIQDAEQQQGKAKLKFDARTPAKRFEINYAPKTGTPFEYVFDFDLSSGFKYDSDLKMNGQVVEKATGDFTWVNNGNKFEVKSDETFTQTKENPFYSFNAWFLFGGRYVEKMDKTRNFFFDKVNKAQLINKMTPAASDLEFGVTITPDRKVVTKFGWEMAGVKKVYLDVVGNNPWMGDYKLSRQGEFEEVSGSVYKIKWTGHGETTNGFLRRISPVETNVVTSFNMNNMKVDAIVWKSFAGQKYGFTLNNDKFTLLAGKH